MHYVTFSSSITLHSRVVLTKTKVVQTAVKEAIEADGPIFNNFDVQEFFLIIFSRFFMLTLTFGGFFMLTLIQ